MTDTDVCAVCQDVFCIPKLLTCGHTFCAECLDRLIETSERPDKIRCPLCRKSTLYPKGGARCLLDNFFVKDQHNVGKIECCTSCGNIAGLKQCGHCEKNVCEVCIDSHTNCGTVRLSSITDDNDSDSDESDEGFTGLQELSMPTATKYYFELDRKFAIPNEYGDDGDSLNINLSRILFYGGDKVITAPNGGNVLLTYDEKGREIDRKFIILEVVSIARGIRGYPLIIGNRTNLVLEHAEGSLMQILCTDYLLPFTLSCLNNGRIVVLGIIPDPSENNTISHRKVGAMQIYEFYGKLVKEVVKVDGNCLFDNPRSIDVNSTNNDIYVGDRGKMKVYRFREDGSLVTSFSKPETVNFGDLRSALVDCNTVFPHSLTYSQATKMLFVSTLSPVDRSILVLSPDLILMGFFRSNERLGVPAGLTCDTKGRLFVGDGHDGVIKVFRLASFINDLSL